MESFPSSSFLLSTVSLLRRKDRRGISYLVETPIAWVAAIFLASYLALGFIFATKFHWTRLIFCLGKGNVKEASWNVPITTTTRSSGKDGVTALDELEKLLVSLAEKKDGKDFHKLNDQELTSLIRSNVEARRLASVVMLQLSKLVKKSELKPSSQILLSRMKEIWLELLALPSMNDREYPFDVSLIVPAYKEKGSIIKSNLLRALKSCHAPEKIQLVLVDAGQNTDIEDAAEFQGDSAKWGNIKLMRFTTGGGRGPCLNFGADHADGKIVTFLHSDNILPDDWDTKVKDCFLEPSLSSSIPITCAFSFKIDTSNEALDGEACARGLAAAQWLGTVRTTYFRVLYGDSVLSMPASYFRYMGGYPPNQALMEDYEVMDLLRKRVLYLEGERVYIDPSETLISPRRWQQNGVTYVTLFNCLCVYLYQNRGWSPEKLYQFYYRRPASPSAEDSSSSTK